MQRAVKAAMRSHTLVGRIGTVVHAVRGSQGPGEVRIVVAGIAHYYIAFATTPIPIGTEVLVINFRGARQVDVEPWPGLPAGGGPSGGAERSP
jgi:membrane protein implicated in regulation of membrane protease activity